MHHSHWVSKAEPGCSLEGLGGVQKDVPSSLYRMALTMPGDTLGSCAHAKIPASHPILRHPELWGPCGCSEGLGQVSFPDLCCLPGGCSRGAFAASSPERPQVCAEPRGATFNPAPRPMFAFPRPGSAVLLGPCLPPAPPRRPAGRFSFRSRSLRLSSRRGQADQLGHRPEQGGSKRFPSWMGSGHVIDGLLQNRSVPCIQHAASPGKKIISFLASACQGEIKNLPSGPWALSVPGSNAARNGTPDTFRFGLLLWHLLTG